MHLLLSPPLFTEAGIFYVPILFRLGISTFMQSLLDKIRKAGYTKFAKQALQKGGSMKTKIPELRKKHKLSQEELALAVGVTRQTITSLEVGKYTASLVLAYKIARFFNKTIEEVFDFSEVEDI